MVIVEAVVHGAISIVRAFATGNGGRNVTPQLPTTYNVTATNFYGTD